MEFRREHRNSRPNLKYQEGWNQSLGSRAVIHSLHIKYECILRTDNWLCMKNVSINLRQNPVLSFTNAKGILTSDTSSFVLDFSHKQ